MQVLDKLFHVPFQFHATPGRHAQHARLMGLLKVVDVAPVRREWFGPCLLGGITLYQCMLASAGRAQCEYVIALVADADAEPDCIDSAWLSDDFIQVLQFRRGLEVKLLREAALVEGVGLQVCDGHVSVPVFFVYCSSEDD